MRYLKENGSYGEYPASFALEDLETLAAFVADKTTLTLEEVSNGSIEDDTIAIRHDVDHDLDHAVRFAEWEQLNGIRSTYFILHSAPYYRDKKALARNVDKLVSLDHEVGVHHNALVVANGNVDESADVFRSAIDSLQAAGAVIYGAAAHGGSVDINNLSFWDHYHPRDFGMQYEAYHLHRSSNYISDNRGTWRAPLEHVSGKQTHMLIHPCHWVLP